METKDMQTNLVLKIVEGKINLTQWIMSKLLLCSMFRYKYENIQSCWEIMVLYLKKKEGKGSGVRGNFLSSFFKNSSDKDSLLD